MWNRSRVFLWNSGLLAKISEILAIFFKILAKISKILATFFKILANVKIIENNTSQYWKTFLKNEKS